MDHQQARYIQTGGITLHVAEAGPRDGPLVILLHGFPEFWYSWRRQIEALAAAGYYVWAPDQRGYNLSDKPAGVRSYSLDALAADVVGLIDAAGRDQAILVGHDWGGGVAWWTASRFPHRVERLVILNVPHGLVLLEHWRRNLRQVLRSWYIFAFQIPRLPEWLARRNNWHKVIDALRKTSRPGTFTEADFEILRQAWSQPGAYRSMVHWYRAILRYRPAVPSNPRIRVPTLLMWGAQDRFLGRELAQPSIDLCDEGRLVFFDDATHWLHHEEAERVSSLMLEFFAERGK